MKLSTIVCSFASCLLLATSTQAAFNLQITEIYHGQENPDVTVDWFEVTNFGDMAWVQGVDGDLFYDDDSSDPAVADPLLGVSTILPGQSVIFVEDGAASVVDFQTAWSNVPGLVVGYHEGSGLGGGGDAVTLFIGDSNFPLDGVINETILDIEAYPAPTAAQDGASWDVELQAYSTIDNLAGAIASASLGGPTGDIPAVGSPGTRIPEPTAAVMALAGLAIAGVRRSRK